MSTLYHERPGTLFSIQPAQSSTIISMSDQSISRHMQSISVRLDILYTPRERRRAQVIYNKISNVPRSYMSPTQVIWHDNYNNLHIRIMIIATHCILVIVFSMYLILAESHIHVGHYLVKMYQTLSTLHCNLYRDLCKWCRSMWASS